MRIRDRSHLWGRFQDANESAYYEFIHRQAGIKPGIYNACLAALRELVETLRQKMREGFR